MLSSENLVNGYKLLDDCFTLHVVWSLLILIGHVFILNTMQDMSLTCFVVTVKQKKNFTPSFTQNGIEGLQVHHIWYQSEVEMLRPIGLKMLQHVSF